jgi:hypothetical protein
MPPPSIVEPICVDDEDDEELIVEEELIILDEDPIILDISPDIKDPKKTVWRLVQFLYLSSFWAFEINGIGIILS